MRITVGGVLLFSGAAAFVAVGPFKLLEPSQVLDQIDGVKKSAEWVMGYFRAPAPELKPLRVEEVPAPPPAVPAPVEPTAPAVNPPEPPPAAVEPVPEAVVAPVKKKRSRRRRARKTPVAAKAPAPAAAAQPAAPQKSAGAQDKLMGTYVALKLKTGREVKGILQGKTEKEYTVEIPGMGPFQYPVDNVTGIGPAE